MRKTVLVAIGLTMLFGSALWRVAQAHETGARPRAALARFN